MFFNATNQRALRELNFEPVGDDYAYFRTWWSSGIPVSAAEREAYLSLTEFGPRHLWRQSIANRQRLGKRKNGPVVRKIFASIPLSFGLVLFCLGLLWLMRSDERGAIWPVLNYMSGGLAILWGSAIIIGHLFRPRGGDLRRS